LKRITRSSVKKRFASSREDHIQSTSLINIDDSQPSSSNENNISLLVDVVVHTVCSAQYLEEEYFTPLLVLVGKRKKRKTFKTPDVCVEKGLAKDQGNEVQCNVEE